MARVLVVDDEERLAKTIAYNLRAEGHEVVVAHDGESALEVFRTEHPDLVVLDLMLPRRSGVEVCRLVREESSVPILMLTAKAGESDKVTGLELGADDYVTKPFGMRELMARVKALLRRADVRAAQVIRLGDLVLDLDRHEVRLREAVVPLPPKEFDLLTLLARNAGRAVRRETLLRQVWGDDFFGDRHTLDVHIRWLREKVEEDASQPKRVTTVRGVGYRLEG
ncbi:MAG: DNA-binding response regulator [Armatimonadetes bacterium CG_4_10_14_3_um_filter_66_18]|nr:MAG: DNA-binding response regulator [Armatimonadetes bacterium CG2_30_66_41]PIU93725.1 MAG: DNA-binding response regulator [Armatimonadetes bacterium CG06_land_8_20_14_3_00_66_21]PIY50304.1 MAG: DNA-binding response regulator [Armatimonadetes bacterium CG_4_10_14_3_um_filter_66_18]PJB63690.1 MAG: DNA-binding response regulator [Armatimonadetes bacterium CG_4_9_14_3_um_filter_66_14]